MVLCLYGRKIAVVHKKTFSTLLKVAIYKRGQMWYNVRANRRVFYART